MKQLLKAVEGKQQKPKVVAVKSGDVVRVHQRIKEGSKERTQVFEGLVIRVDRKQSMTYRITVRRIASGVGVEKSFVLHSPLIQKVEVVKRSKVRRNYLSYMRNRSGKKTKLAAIEFNKDDVNLVSLDEQIDAEVGKVEKQKPASKTEETGVADTDIKEEENTQDAETVEKSEPAKDEKAQLSKDEKAKLKKQKAEEFRKAKSEK